MPPKPVGPVDLELSNDETLIVSLTFCMGFYADVPFSQIGPQTLKIWERFQSLCGKGTLSFYATDTMSRHKPVSARALGMLATWLKPGAPVRETVGISYQESQAFNGAPHWSFDVLGREAVEGVRLDAASVVRLALPPEFGIDRPAEMEKLFSEICGLAPFRSGRAGFAFLCSRYWEQEATEHAWAKSMRHPGIDIVEVTNETLMIGLDAIMGIDWLNYLDDRFVRELGGARAISKAAKSSAVVVQAGPSGGTIVRAGTVPKFGDLNRGDALPEYKAVYTALAPLMKPALDRMQWLNLEHDEDERTRAWLLRHAPVPGSRKSGNQTDLAGARRPKPKKRAS